MKLADSRLAGFLWRDELLNQALDSLTHSNRSSVPPPPLSITSRRPSSHRLNTRHGTTQRSSRHSQNFHNNDLPAPRTHLRVPLLPLLLSYSFTLC